MVHRPRFQRGWRRKTILSSIRERLTIILATLQMWFSIILVKNEDYTTFYSLSF